MRSSRSGGFAVLLRHRLRRRRLRCCRLAGAFGRQRFQLQQDVTQLGLDRSRRHAEFGRRLLDEPRARLGAVEIERIDMEGRIGRRHQVDAQRVRRLRPLDAAHPPAPRAESQCYLPLARHHLRPLPRRGLRQGGG